MNIVNMQQQGAVTTVWLAEHTGTLNLMLSSDVHYDSSHCNRTLYKKHLDAAKEKGAYIILAGDILDAMQGRYDYRRSYDDIRKEYVGEKYYDLIVEDTAQFHEPYADNLLVFGKGNHEASIIRHANTDLLSRVVDRLRLKGSRVVTGGYGGWIVFHFGDKYRACFRLRYFHGAGGDAPVTKGMIQTNRQAVYLPDADLIHNGHNHHEYVTSSKRERISSKGKQYFDIVHFVRTPGYKDGYGDGTKGFEAENGHPPKPNGCAWVSIEVDRKGGTHATCTGDVA